MMLSVFRCPIVSGAAALRRSMLRYGVLRRLRASCDARGVTMVAFGLGEAELRMVLEGGDDDILNVVRGVKGGTCRASRAWEELLLWGDTERRATDEAGLAAAVAWCHAVGPGADPLANPWTSHRDLLGFRKADFYDARSARHRVDALEVHRQCGGAPLTDATTPTDDAGLDRLLRVAAAVQGVLPGDRQCFRLFVHLARSFGWNTRDLADALCLTGRRIRQLASAHEPLLPLALAHLSDDRLCRVP